MRARTWVRTLFARPATRPIKAPPRCRPAIEALEDRLAPAAAITGAAVVSSPSSATLHGTVHADATVSTWFQYSTDRAFSPTLARTVGSGFNNPTGVALCPAA